MAYNSVAQTEHEAIADELGSDRSDSPRLTSHSPYEPLSTDPTTHGESMLGDAAKVTAEPSGSRLSSILQSIASTRSSYHVVDDDDYDQPQGSPRLTGDDESELERPLPLCIRNPDDSFNQNQSNNPEDPPESPLSEPMIARSPDSPVPLKHPTPGLQSLHGAYRSNVERLERSAEELSLTSDIGEELRKLKEQQKKSESRRSSLNQQQSDEEAMAPTRRRQFSTSSLSNSIIRINSVARSGGYSPGGFMASPRGSIRSGSYSHGVHRLSHVTSLPEPEQEGRPLDSPLTAHSVPITAYPFHKPYALTEEPEVPPHTSNLYVQNPSQSLTDMYQQTAEPDPIPDRPPTAASTDTYRQASTLFRDFDGVHFSPLTKPQSPPPGLTDEYDKHLSFADPASLSLTHPAKRESQILNEPRSPPQSPPEGMLYYPAPVPMMLNLPQRLSKLPSAREREKRRSQVLGAIAAENRKSAVWMGDSQAQPLSPKQNDKRKSAISLLPPQLRASAFFDQPIARPEVKLQGDSAMKTLDSILDASAFAPVTAFTDHPFAGPVGSEVYGHSRERLSSGSATIEKDKKANRRSSINLLKGRRLSSVPVHDGKLRKRSSVILLAQAEDEAKAKEDMAEDAASPRTAHLDDDPDHNSEAAGALLGEQGDEEAKEEGDKEGEGDGEPEYFGAPTTLLAELQVRKQQLKQRNRTAADTFPNGMHSTLLELDAVAQFQTQANRKKHIKLAWEDPEAHLKTPNDDDVPLGMLFPQQRPRSRERPLGLMEKRDIEDNEPLSRRRARLRGTDTLQPMPVSPNGRAETMLTLDLPGIDDTHSQAAPEEEGETLAQRIRRLKTQNKSQTSLKRDDQGENLKPEGRPLSGDFASEIMSQLGDVMRQDDSPEGTPKKAPAAEDPEETLGQRRKRLQAERDTQAPRSMANILQAAPVRNPGESQVRREVRPGLINQTSKPPISSRVNLAANGVMTSGPGVPGINPTLGASGIPYAKPGVYNQAAMRSVGNLNMAYNGGFGNKSNVMLAGKQAQIPVAGPMNENQRDMIDRWRQSVA
ncbi:MAG: hypothetical protein M1834_003033 [Cirrosporium novae-zelandiae]|nr:MAG: hypothetical protein M1834_003033 [Cirrosporium novae-zelandiae]